MSPLENLAENLHIGIGFQTEISTANSPLVLLVSAKTARTSVREKYSLFSLLALDTRSNIL